MLKTPTHNAKRTTLVLVVLLATLTLAMPAGSAASVGTLVITANTTLSEDHSGTLVIEENNVTLDCAGHSVEAPDVAIPGTYGAIHVQPGRSGVTVKRCHVMGSSVNGIYAFGLSNGRFEGNILEDNAAWGIDIEGGSANVVVGNTSRENAHGLGIHDVSNSRVEDNILEANSGHGLVIEGGSGHVVVGNRLRGNDAFGSAFTGVVDSEVDANVAENNAWAGVAVLDGSQYVTVKHCRVVGSDGVGILALGLSNGRFEGNILENNGNWGIEIDGGSGNVVLGNTSRKNAYGLKISNQSNSRVENNILEGNAAHGVHIDGGSGHVVVGNTVRENDALGIVFTAVVDSEIRANVAENNGWTGVALSSFEGPPSQRITVVGNTARSNGIYGFSVEGGSSGNTISGNKAIKNAGGYAIFDSSNNTLEGNQAIQQVYWAFGLLNAVDNTLTSNVADQNGSEGFVLTDGCTGNTLTKNRANSNELGFSLWAGATGNTLTRNVAQANRDWDAEDQNGPGLNTWLYNTFGTTQGT